MDKPQTDDLTARAVRVMGLEGLPPPVVTPLYKGGSDRTFYRLAWPDRSVLMMHYRHERQENNYYAPIGRFLREIGVAVPEIYHHDAARGFLLMEDLGDRDLWSYRNAAWEIRRLLYEKTLGVVRKLHAYPLENDPRETVPLMDGFDQKLYRWERDYFRENFLAGVCGIHLPPEEDRLLEAELNALALRLAATGPTLIHRDFQSQNVMVRHGEPVLIDFQGMRAGNPLYDLGSLLYDPYVRISPEERRVLLASYFAMSETGTDWPAFQERFREASAQRLMQALGAYGFLGLKKGRRDFLEHIDRGLQHLTEVTGQAAHLRALHALTVRCGGILAERPLARIALTPRDG